MKNIFFVFFVCMGFISVAQQKYIPIRQHYLWGFADTLGNEVYPPSFEFVSEEVSSGFFVASKKGKYALISYPNEISLPFEYESITKVSQQLVEVSKEGQKSLFHTTEKLFKPLVYDNFFRLKNPTDTLYAFEHDGKIGLMDKNGNPLLDANFTAIQDRISFVVLKNNTEVFVYNKRQLHPIQADSVGEFIVDSTALIVFNKQNKQGLFLPYKFKTLSPSWDDITRNWRNNEFLFLHQKDSFQVYNIRRDKLSPRYFTKFNPIDSLFYIVYKNDSSAGIIDHNFKEVLPFQYSTIFNQLNSVYYLKKGDKYNLFFRNTMKIVTKEYDQVSQFQKGIAFVFQHKKVGLINQFGVEIVPPIYTSFSKNDLEYTFKSNDHVRWVLVTKEGNVEKERRFSQLETVSLSSDFSNLNIELDSAFNVRDQKKKERSTSRTIYEDPNGRFKLSINHTGILNARFYSLYDINSSRNLTPFAYWSIDFKGFKFADFVPATMDGGRKVLIHYTGRTLNSAKYWDGKRELERPILRLDTFNTAGYAIYASGIFRRQKLYGEPVVLGDDAKWGLINKKGKAVIPAKFQEIINYQNGFLICKSDNKIGVVNVKGDTIVEFKYDDVSFLEGSNETVFLVKVYNPKYGMVAKNGDEITNVEFKTIRPFSEKYAAVRHPNFEGWNFINRKGDFIQETVFQRSNDFSEGLAAVRLKNKWGFIDTSGNVVLDFQYELAGSFKNGLCPVKRFKTNGYVYINKNQEVVLEGFDKAHDFDKGLALVSKNGKLRLINTTGKILFTFKINVINRYLNDWGGYQVLVDGSKISFFDSSGTQVIPNEKEAPLVSGFKVVKVDKFYGYITGYGTWLVKPRFNSALEFSENKAAVKVGSLWGFIDFTGEIKLKPQFKSLHSFHNDVAKGENIRGEKMQISSTFEVSPTLLGEAFSTNYDTYTLSGSYSLNSDQTSELRKVSLYSKDGKKMFQNSFHFINSFDDELAKVGNYSRLKNKELVLELGLINKYGYIKTPVLYNKIERDENGDYLVFKNTFSGLVDRLGNEIIPPNFEQIKKMEGCNLYQVREGGKIGYINQNGDVIVVPRR